MSIPDKIKYMNKKSIKYEVGFADSEILSYETNNDGLLIYLKCWNEKILHLQFVDCILFLILDSWQISDICETADSQLLDKSLQKVYEIIPDQHPYKVFQFIDNEDDPVIEIACTNIIISVND